MHRYQPVIHIVRASDPSLTTLGAPSRQFHFPETQFVAVTAYQVLIHLNFKILTLKDTQVFTEMYIYSSRAQV